MMAAPRTFTMTQLVALWIKAGGSLGTAPAAVAHAWAESSGRPAVTSPNPDGGTNVGLWQLDTKGVGAGHSVAELQDPLTNAQITVKGSGGGRNWGPWPDDWQASIAAATAAAHGFGVSARVHPGGQGGLINDILGALTGGFTSAGTTVQQDLSRAISLPSQVTDFLSAAERFTHAALWIVDPAHWARILAGVAGAVLVLLGLSALARAA
jgi:hypothetical protein